MEEKKRLITSALPYVNNIPHLGNLIQVLSADVFARYCRSRGYETLYICGTDEYGTATETKALSEGISPKELCDRFYKVHTDIYKWFNISFDRFGRTSTSEQTEIVQYLFKKLYDAGYIFEQEITQLYSEQSKMFLADRYVRGSCPKCNYDSARGDQCESCGCLLDPFELINPVSAIDQSIPVPKKTKHLYIDLPKMLPKLTSWIEEAEQKQLWSRNAIQMSKAWLRDGLHARAITRDLKWGIPVPLEGYEDKVFYVWFDAPIGYISITANHIFNWKEWWKNPQQVQLYQFIGKDNIPFHTVIFPATLIGSGDEWTMLYSISSSEYLNYEDGMFSKSKGVGVFGNDVITTGIPADVWRFYMMYNRPESSDYLFTWKDFQEAVNSELVNNLSNLYNRTLTFISKYFESNIQTIDLQDEETKQLWEKVFSIEQEITKALENLEIRGAYLKIFSLSDYANKMLQQYEPWNLRKDNPEKAKWVLSNLVYIIRDLIALIEPYTPDMAQRMARSLGIPLPTWRDLVSFSNVQTLDTITTIEQPELLFTRLEDEQMQQFKEQYSGSQAERDLRQQKQDAEKENNSKSEPDTSPQMFAKKICLKVAKVIDVQKHPDADKLYILTLDDGSEEGRTIVSGIREYYEREDLLEKYIIVVANLKPAKLRGVVSNGMLLAASGHDTENPEKEIVDVLFVEGASPGAIVHPSGEPLPSEYSTVKVDAFFTFTIMTNTEKRVEVENIPLVVQDNNAQEITVYSKKIANAKVG